MTGKNIIEQLEEEGCKRNHRIEMVSKIHTNPLKYKYKCQDCGATAVSNNLYI